MTEISLLIVEKSFDMLTLFGSTGMLWWVSGIVFCVSLIRMYMGYDCENCDLNKSFIVVITVLITLFMCSTVTYGLVMAYQVNELFINTSSIVGIGSEKIEPFYNTIRSGYLIGTSSFFLILICWIFVVINKIQKDE